MYQYMIHCIALTRKGIQCQRYASHGNYCYQHQSKIKIHLRESFDSYAVWIRSLLEGNISQITKCMDFHDIRAFSL